MSSSHLPSAMQFLCASYPSLFDWERQSERLRLQRQLSSESVTTYYPCLLAQCRRRASSPGRNVRSFNAVRECLDGAESRWTKGLPFGVASLEAVLPTDAFVVEDRNSLPPIGAVALETVWMWTPASRR